MAIKSDWQYKFALSDYIYVYVCVSVCIQHIQIIIYVHIVCECVCVLYAWQWIGHWLFCYVRSNYNEGTHFPEVENSWHESCAIHAVAYCTINERRIFYLMNSFVYVCVCCAYTMYIYYMCAYVCLFSWPTFFFLVVFRYSLIYSLVSSFWPCLCLYA